MAASAAAAPGTVGPACPRNWYLLARSAELEPGAILPRGLGATELVLYRGFHRFIPTLLKMRGYRVIEVPVSHRPRRYGRSKYGVWNRAAVAFADLLAIRWMKARLLRYEIVEDVGGDLIRD